MKFFDVIEDAPIGIIKTNRSLAIEEANAPALSLLGLNPEEYHHFSLSEFFKGEQIERFSSMFSDPEATPQKSGFIHDGDKRRKVRISVSLIGDTDLIWYIEDRHETWTLEQEINTYRRLPREYGHDMNNLLTVILSASQMLKYDLDENSPLLEDIADIADAANRAAAQTHQFMNLGRRLIIDPETLSIHSLIKDNFHLLQSIIGEGQFHLPEMNDITPVYAPKISVLSSIIYLLLHMRTLSPSTNVKLVLERVLLSAEFSNTTLGVPFQEAISVTLCHEDYPIENTELHSKHNKTATEADYLTLCWEGMRRANGAIFSRKTNNAHCISLYFPDISSAL
ncbi:MAG: PAS domain-containing protein [Myxococcota bacterium]|nr:PAS domain-containing protein [Myxococcota bacterium]